MSFAAWRKRRAARAALRSGDPWVCPYCRELHPRFEVGGTKLAFGYPSVRFACCGKVAFLLKDPKTGELMSFTRIGEGITEWLPAKDYFAWVEESAKARGRRDTTPHQFIKEGAEGSQRAGKLQLAQPAHAEAPAPAPAAPAAAAPAKPLTWVSVCRAADVPASGTGKVVEVNGRRVALFHVGGEVRAIDNTCAHKAGPLGEGSCEDGIVTCPMHGWRYDVRTGKCENNPKASVPVYAVKVEGDSVLLGA